MCLFYITVVPQIEIKWWVVKLNEDWAIKTFKVGQLRILNAIKILNFNLKKKPGSRIPFWLKDA